MESLFVLDWNGLPPPTGLAPMGKGSRLPPALRGECWLSLSFCSDGDMIREPRVHSSLCVLKESKVSRILGLRFNQYSNSYRERGTFETKPLYKGQVGGGSLEVVLFSEVKNVLSLWEVHVHLSFVQRLPTIRDSTVTRSELPRP